jgi:diketogulonate reductase-like aldo/keto reductase
MVGVRLGLSEHIEENKKIFTLTLDDEDRGRIKSVLRRSKDLMKVTGDCGAEYRRA